MILHGNKKRVLTEVIRYFVASTNSKYDDFILVLNHLDAKSDSELTYTEWLAKKSYAFLKQHQISIQDCLENKDIINAAINEHSSRQEGEFFTPPIWCVEGREYLRRLLGDLWGKAYVWDASCGSGNLMRTEGYPADKLFLSSLLEEDIAIVKSSPEYAGVEAFQLDFLNEIDWDRNNLRFSDNLPPKLRQVLENNEPLVFYMNPPYKVMEANSSDVGSYMASHGMARCALDIFHQFMYRILLLKRTYNLTNLYLGVFGPLTMFHSRMLEPLYEDFKSDFVFEDGFCFDAADFANTSESVGWVVGLTTWRTKVSGDTDRSMVLDAKTIGSDGNSASIGSRLVTNVEVNIDKWVEAKDIVRYTDSLPMVSTYKTFTGQFMQVPPNFLGYMMSSSDVKRGTRRAAVTSLPTLENIPITEENFWRCVASFVARRCYASKQNPYNNCQYYSKPDTSIEGYEAWIIDALVLFLFDHSSHFASYRELVMDGFNLTLGNKLFPISQEIVSSIVTDEVILADLANHRGANAFLLKLLSTYQNSFSPEATDLYRYCLELIVLSLTGDTRKRLGYCNWTMAWDAGFLQLRDTPGLFTQEQLERYSYLVSRLKHKLYNGIYKFGFLMDTEFMGDASNLSLDDDQDDLATDNEEVVL